MNKVNFLSKQLFVCFIFILNLYTPIHSSLFRTQKKTSQFLQRQIFFYHFHANGFFSLTNILVQWKQSSVVRRIQFESKLKSISENQHAEARKNGESDKKPKVMCSNINLVSKYRYSIYNKCITQISLDPKWEKYACGKTKDQLFMTQLAHMILRKSSLQPRALNFFKN